MLLAIAAKRIDSKIVSEVGVGVGVGVGVEVGATATTLTVITNLLARYLSVSSVTTTMMQFPTFSNLTTYKGTMEQILEESLDNR